MIGLDLHIRSMGGLDGEEDPHMLIVRCLVNCKSAHSQCSVVVTTVLLILIAAAVDGLFKMSTTNQRRHCPIELTIIEYVWESSSLANSIRRSLSFTLNWETVKLDVFCSIGNSSIGTDRFA